MHGYVGCILYHQSPRHQVGMGSLFRPTTQGEHGRPSSSPVPRLVGGGDAVCDAQADVPWPEGFGRNLRSKTRWFTGFCNSHQVSHFATFFIDARAEISVAESRSTTSLCRLALAPGTRAKGGQTVVHVPWRIARRGLLFCQGAVLGTAPGLEEGPTGRQPLPDHNI